MSTLYIQHGTPGEPMSTERVKHQITDIPAKRHPAKGKYEATNYLVRVGGIWRRVWASKDATPAYHVTYNYRKVAVIIREGN